MSGASEAATMLRSATMARYEPLRDRVAETARAVIRLREADDLMQVMQATNGLSLAAEALADAAKDLHETADKALASCMDTTGGTTFRTDGHVVSLRQNPPGVDIPDAAAVPEQYLTTPKPQPDRSKIRCALKADPTINWAVLRDGTLGLQRKALT